MTSITPLSPVPFYGLVDSPASSIDENGGSRGDGSAVIPTALAASAAAIDGEGTAIEANGLTKSGEMTITGYSDSRFSTELSCSIDTLPTYWSGSPVTLSGLPPSWGTCIHYLESMGDEITAQSFSWEISE